MNLITICVLISSLSFLFYVYSYFNAPYMKAEFRRFGLNKMGFAIIILEFIGAIGLLIGLINYLILIISSLGLALLMFAGIMVRIKVKDSIWITLPAFFYMILNTYIFWTTINLKA